MDDSVLFHRKLPFCPPLHLNSLLLLLLCCIINATAAVAAGVPFAVPPPRIRGREGGRQAGSSGSEAMGSSSAVRSKEAGGGGGGAEEHHMRALAARTVTDSLRAAVARSSAAEKVARFEECARNLEAEKAKMEVFRRELPISVHLIGDVIEWLRDEVEQHRRPAPELLVPAPSPSPAPTAKRKAEGVKAEADASDKRSWMSSAQLWTCGSHSSTSTSNDGSARKQAQKVSNAFMPLNGLPVFTKSSEKSEAATVLVPDLSLSSPANDAPCPAAPSANSSAITDAGAQHQQSAQRKARRCWSPELHRRFVAALQRLGGPQAATPKQIREMMKVDGLTNDEVKSHLQKYRLHTRRASDVGGDQQQAASGMWPPPDQYTTSQHSSSQSGSPQGPLRLTVSSRAMSVTAGDSCEGDVEEEEEEEDGKSASYSWEENGTKALSA